MRVRSPCGHTRAGERRATRLLGGGSWVLPTIRAQLAGIIENARIIDALDRGAQPASRVAPPSSSGEPEHGERILRGVGASPGVAIGTVVFRGAYRLDLAARELPAGDSHEQVVSAARSPWQNPYVERVIGSLRRECTDHVIVMGASHLRRVLREYVAYYNADRTHVALDKDSPATRPVLPPGRGQVIALPRVGGLHHRYDRGAA
jgi:integrase-like protein